MSADGTTSRYPLEALRQREGWRLDALQAELGASARRLVDTDAHCQDLRHEFRAVAAQALPVVATAIDPVVARSRLLYLGVLQMRVAAAARSVAEAQQSRDRIRLDCGRQHCKVEAIERHRQGFLRGETARLDRLQSAEADRDWLTRAWWRHHRDGELAKTSACAPGNDS